MSVNIIPETLTCAVSFGFKVVKVFHAIARVFPCVIGFALGSAKACLAMVAVDSDMPPPFRR